MTNSFSKQSYDDNNVLNDVLENIIQTKNHLKKKLKSFMIKIKVCL